MTSCTSPILGSLNIVFNSKASIIDLTPLARVFLFICGGAFSGLDKVIARRGSDSSIGFGANVKHFQDQSSGELIKNLEPEDLIKYGLIPEFVGRMPILATLQELDEKSLVKILQEPKNSLIKQYKTLFEFENV